MKVVFSFLSVFALLLISCMSSYAASYAWNTPASGGAWTTTTLWTPTAPAGGPPAGSDIRPLRKIICTTN